MNICICMCMCIYIYMWPRAKTLVLFGASFWICARGVRHQNLMENPNPVTAELGLGSFAMVFHLVWALLLIKPMVFHMDCAQLG